MAPQIEGLNFKTLEYVDENELNSLIEKHFGRKWTHQQNGDMVNNDSYDCIYFGEEADWEPGADYIALFGMPEYPYNSNHRVEKFLADESYKTDRYYRAGREDYVFTSDFLNVLRKRGIIPDDMEEIYVWVSW